MKIVWHMPTLRHRGCGLSIRAVKLAKRLRASGHKLSFVVRREKTDIDDGGIDGIPVSTVSVTQRRPIHWCLQAQARWDVAVQVVEEIGREHDVLISCQPEVVAAYASANGEWRMANSEVSRSPVILVCGGTTLLHGAAERADQASLGAVRRLPYAVDRRLKHGHERRAFRSADAVVFDSDHTRELVMTTYGLEPERCHTVHGGVDAEWFRPVDSEARARAREELGVRASDVVVVWTGRLSPEKNLGLLLRALPQCVRMPDRVLLVGGGPERGALTSLVSTLGLGEVVSFVGEQADVRPFLRAGDVFAFPSRGESFGSSLVEAMACGMACLGLAPDGRCVCNANGEIIEHGRSGILASPAEPAAFASALDALIGDRALQLKLGAAARQRACERFTWDAGGRLLNEVILKLAGAIFRSDIHAGEAESKRLSASEVVR